MAIMSLLFALCFIYTAEALLYPIYYHECMNHEANRMGYLIQQAHINGDLDNGPFTYFCPKDIDFPEDLYLKILKNDTWTKEVAKYHIVRGIHRSTNFANEEKIQTFQEGGYLRANLYNDSSKTMVTVNGGRLKQPDIQETFKPGIVHITDKLFYPMSTDSIYDLITKQSIFSTLLYAVTKAKMQASLQAAHPLTVFAPSNQAFQNLPPGVYNSLLNNQTRLVDVLSYHVVNGTYYTAGLFNNTKLMTINHKELTFNIHHGTVVIDNKVNITKNASDVSASNGVVHTIDAVLLPPT